MDLEATVAAPFAREGRERLGEGEFVVALSLDRDWFSPDQAKRLVDRAVAEGVLERADGELSITVDPSAVSIPADAEPGEELLRDRSPFERILAALVDAGAEKRAAVAAINELQADRALTIDAAAVLYARREGVDVDGPARAARAALLDAGDGGTD